MSVKCLQIQVELEIQAVTCPGVWLCPKGNVSLHWNMLGSHIRTAPLYPLFPLLYHEKFNFYKTFFKVHNLSRFQEALDHEIIYGELIQWKDCRGTKGSVLATFRAFLSDVLYPDPDKSTIAGVDIDLLMDATKSFPGIIAPKIEVAIKTTIEEILSETDSIASGVYVINPKTVSSNHCPCLNTRVVTPRLQRKVCHSLSYHRDGRCVTTRRGKKPPFVMRKIPNDLIHRKIEYPLDEQDQTQQCKHCWQPMDTTGLSERRKESNAYYNTLAAPHKTYVQMTDSFLKRYPNTKQSNLLKEKLHSSGQNHGQGYCPVCTNYKHSFKRDTKCHCEYCNYQPSSPKASSKCDCLVENPDRPSLAKQIHEKLSRVLSCAPTFPFIDRCHEDNEDCSRCLKEDMSEEASDRKKNESPLSSPTARIETSQPYRNKIVTDMRKLYLHNLQNK